MAGKTKALKSSLKGLVQNMETEMAGYGREAAGLGVQYLAKRVEDIRGDGQDLLTGKISEKEYRDLMKDHLSLDVMELNKLSVESRLKAQDLTNRMILSALDLALKAAGCV